MTMTEHRPPEGGRGPLRVDRRTHAASASRNPQSKRRRVPRVPLAIAIVFFLGIGVLLYPGIAAWFTQYQQSQQIKEYSTEVVDLGPDQREQAIAEASAYNDTLTGVASIAANERLPLSDGGGGGGGDGGGGGGGDGGGEVDEYRNLLSADSRGLMARIKIPSIDVDLPIYHGTSDAVLERAIGHLEGTALPVGGDSTHSVLTGHRGLATAELFTNLDKVEVGDTFTIEVFGEVLTYQVRETKVVAPDETETLYPQRGRDLVTLVTCTPLGINSHRILVTAERILPTPIDDVNNAGAAPEIPGFPWWAVGLAAAFVVLSLYVWYSARAGRRVESAP